jgi:hypothetical protein
MTPLERDDLAHAINQLMAFYDKELTPGQMKLWLQALSMRQLDDLKAAMRAYLEKGKFAPRPAHILEIVEANRFERISHEAPKRLENKPKEAPREVRRAWAFVIKLWGMGDMYKVGDVSPEEQDRMIELCNRQAKQSGNAESIPPDAFRPDIWGMTYEQAIARQGAA